MLKINLGCGEDFNDDLVGIDICNYGQIYILDLEKDLLPFEDDSVEYIKSNHFLEHLIDPKNCLNEAWRVLKKGRQFEIKVPYGLWEGAQKPVHHQCITESWFDFLRKERNFKIYGYRCWEIVKMERVNKGAEIHCILIPKK